MRTRNAIILAVSSLLVASNIASCIRQLRTQIYQEFPQRSPTEAAVPSVRCIPEPDGHSEGLVTIWFDDGRDDTYLVAYPLMKQSGYRGVLAIIADRDMASQKLAPGNVTPMSWEQVAELVDEGWEISSHSLTHCRLDQLPMDSDDGRHSLSEEIVRSKTELENRGFTVSTFTAPYGRWSEESITLATELYRGFRTLVAGVNPLPVTGFKLSSCAIRNHTTTEEMQGWIRQAEAEHGWLIITIHTVTDRPDNDWDISIKQFVDMLRLINESSLAVVTASEALDHPGFGQPTPATATTVAPYSVPTVTPPPVISPDVFSNTVMLHIPAIDVHTRIAAALPTEDGESLDFSELDNVPMWVSDTRGIGEYGVAVIAGHRQWGPTPKIFARLDQLGEGDIVQIVTAQHVFLFVVNDPNVVIDPDEVEAEIWERDAQAEESGASVLALLTCTPYGTALQRLIAFAALEGVEEVHNQ